VGSGVVTSVCCRVVCTTWRVWPTHMQHPGQQQWQHRLIIPAARGAQQSHNQPPTHHRIPALRLPPTHLPAQAGVSVRAAPVCGLHQCAGCTSRNASAQAGVSVRAAPAATPAPPPHPLCASGDAGAAQASATTRGSAVVPSMVSVAGWHPGSMRSKAATAPSSTAALMPGLMRRSCRRGRPEAATKAPWLPCRGRGCAGWGVMAAVAPSSKAWCWRVVGLNGVACVVTSEFLGALSGLGLYYTLCRLHPSQLCNPSVQGLAPQYAG